MTIVLVLYFYLHGTAELARRPSRQGRARRDDMTLPINDEGD